jgi:hypothetical protein
MLNMLILVVRLVTIVAAWLLIDYFVWDIIRVIKEY